MASERSRGPVDRRSAPGAVIFDLDDTLFDHRHAVRAGLERLRTDHEVLRSVSIAELETRYFALLEELDLRWMAVGRDVISARTERFQRLFEQSGESLTRDAAADQGAVYRETYLASQRLVPGAGELLRSLSSDRRLVILSNNRQEEQESKLRAVGADRWIDALVTSETVGVAKPARRMFDRAIREAAVPRDACVMVGDAWAADVEGAQSAGLKAVWFNPRGLPAPSGRSVPELRSWRPLDEVAALLLALSRPAAPGPARLVGAFDPRTRSQRVASDL